MDPLYKGKVMILYDKPVPEAIATLFLNTGTIDEDGFIKVQDDLYVHPIRVLGTFKSQSISALTQKGGRLATLKELNAIHSNLPFILSIIESLQLTNVLRFDRGLDWVYDVKHHSNGTLAFCFSMKDGLVIVSETANLEIRSWVSVKGSL